jgi:hypothetical protein
MYHLLYHSATLNFAHRMYLSVLYDSQNKPIIFLNHKNKFIFVMGTQCVFFEVTGFLCYLDELWLQGG